MTANLYSNDPKYECNRAIFASFATHSWTKTGAVLGILRIAMHTAAPQCSQITTKHLYIL